MRLFEELSKIVIPIVHAAVENVKPATQLEFPQRCNLQRLASLKADPPDSMPYFCVAAY